MRTFEFFVAKNLIRFFENYGVSARTRDDEAVWTFHGGQGRRGGQVLQKSFLNGS